MDMNIVKVASGFPHKTVWVRCSLIPFDYETFERFLDNIVAYLHSKPQTFDFTE